MSTHLIVVAIIYNVCAFLTAFSLILGYDFKPFAGIALLSYLTFSLLMEFDNGGN